MLMGRYLVVARAGGTVQDDEPGRVRQSNRRLRLGLLSMYMFFANVHMLHDRVEKAGVEIDAGRGV